jgi:hypothetical protein
MRNLYCVLRGEVPVAWGADSFLFFLEPGEGLRVMGRIGKDKHTHLLAETKPRG